MQWFIIFFAFRVADQEPQVCVYVCVCVCVVFQSIFNFFSN